MVRREKLGVVRRERLVGVTGKRLLVANRGNAGSGLDGETKVGSDHCGFPQLLGLDAKTTYNGSDKESGNDQQGPGKVKLSSSQTLIVCLNV